MSAGRSDFDIRQGETWIQVVRWYSETFGYAKIASVAKTAPVAITTESAHGIPDQWLVAVVGCKGMRELNAEHDPPEQRDYQPATVIGPSTIELNAVNAVNFGTYTAGGVIMYRQPVDLAGYLARMHIRESVEASATLLELSSPSNGIVIDNTAKTITITITAAQTQAIAWETAVYDLELESPSGIVTRLLEGRITVAKEVTR